jgi:hypothetical protein
MKLAGLHHLQGRTDLAEPAMRTVITGMSRSLSATAPMTLQARSNLLAILLDAGRAAEAVDPARVLAADAERALADTDETSLHARHSLARALNGVGRRAEAIRLLTTTLPDSERGRGADHPATLGMRTLFAELLVEAGDHRAGREARAALAGWERVHGPGHPQTAQARKVLRRLR